MRGAAASSLHPPPPLPCPPPPPAARLVAAACLGLRTCTVPASSEVFGDPCPNAAKSLTFTYRWVGRWGVRARARESGGGGMAALSAACAPPPPQRHPICPATLLLQVPGGGDWKDACGPARRTRGQPSAPLVQAPAAPLAAAALPAPASPAALPAPAAATTALATQRSAGQPNPASRARRHTRRCGGRQAGRQPGEEETALLHGSPSALGAAHSLPSLSVRCYSQTPPPAAPAAPPPCCSPQILGRPPRCLPAW